MAHYMLSLYQHQLLKVRLMNLFTKFLLISCTLLSSTAHSVTITTFTDSALWEAAVSSYSQEDFEMSPSVTASQAGDTFTLDDFEIVIDKNHGSIEIDSSGTGPIIGGTKSFFGDVHSVGGTEPQFQTLNFFNDISAFAADFAEGDADGITLHVLGQSLPITFSGITFFGFISDTAFSSVNITGGSTGSGFYVMDNVKFVPEPSALLLFSLGLIGFGFIRKSAK